MICCTKEAQVTCYSQDIAEFDVALKDDISKFKTTVLTVKSHSITVAECICACNTTHALLSLENFAMGSFSILLVFQAITDALFQTAVL